VVTLKRALIVDDSKSARVVLSRLLEKHELAVETRESAEGALEYLEQNHPDVIFMDHVMSGMDGLSAVQLIKKNPKTASIPVLMYTSQDGSIYAEAAKASGADAVLPKQMSPADIADALVRMKVIPTRPAVPATDKAVTAETAVPPTVPALNASDIRATVEPVVREQAAEIRRYLSTQLESLSSRLASEIKSQVQAAAADVIYRLTPPPPEPPAPPPRPWGWIGAVAGAIAAVAVLAVFDAHNQAEMLAMRATIDRQAAALATLPQTAAPAQNAAWPSERHPLGFGEAPFTPARIAQASAWLTALEQRGFVGTARLVVSQAEYCLTGNPGDGYQVAPAELPASNCDMRGSPADEARTAADREPAALMALASGLSARTHGEIETKIVYVKASGYPPAGATAGQWNGVAAKEHYVEFVAQSRTP
jgi:CheY-like chemotaxis protein